MLPKHFVKIKKGQNLKAIILWKLGRNIDVRIQKMHHVATMCTIHAMAIKNVFVPLYRNVYVTQECTECVFAFISSLYMFMLFKNVPVLPVVPVTQVPVPSVLQVEPLYSFVC